MSVEQQPPVPSRKKRRPWRWLVVSAVTILVLLVGAMGIVIARASSIAAYVTERALPGVEAKIGRKITIGGVRVRVLPNPHAEVSHLTISGADGEPPLVDAAQVSATVELWPLIRSFGRDVRIHNVEISQPTVHLVRRANGTWSHSEVVDALSSGAPSPGERHPEITGVDVDDGRVVVIDRSGGKAASKNRAAIALERIDVKARNLFQEDATVRVDAALGPTKSKHNVRADLKLTSTPGGHVTLTSIAFAAVRSFLPEGVDAIVSRGTVTIDGNVNQTKSGAFVLDGNVRLADLSLGGKPASGKMHVKGSLDPKSEALAGSIDGLDMQAEGTRLGGTASFATTPPRGEFDLQGEQLDLDAIVGGGASSEPPSKPVEGSDWMPSDVRDRIAAVKVAGRLRLGKVTRGALQLESLDARGDLQHGTFRLADATARLYGGTLALSGTSVDLRPARPVWSLQAKLDGTDLGQSTEQIAKVRALDGSLGGTLQLHGAGSDWPSIRTSVTGQGAFIVRNATLGTDLQSHFADAFVEVLQGLAMEKKPGDLPRSNKTQLGDLHANVAVQDGWLRLTSPLDAQTPFGAVHVDGRIGLDRNLDLTGTVQLSPQFLQTLTAGRLVPRAPIAVPIAVRGTASDPRFQVTMAPADVAQLLVAAGALPGLGNLGRGIGGGPVPGVPTVPSAPTAPGVPRLPHLPVLPVIPGITAPPTGDAGASPH